MKKMVKINVVLISLLLISGGMINAQGRGRGMEPGQYCSNIPGITEKQKADLTELATKHRAEMDALRAERQGAKDRDAWYAAGQKMSAATDKHRFDILNVLTDEQKQNFAPRAGFGPAGQPNGRGRAMMAPGRGAGRGPGMCPAMMAPGRMGGGRGWRY
ncbi:MAG: hypothetical protein IH591_08535 [Bacteroidales bacterium]|nr:hypothetical protein [Bacteroidales bacterium]